MRPEEVCVCSRKPASDKSAITLRIVAGLSPSRLVRDSVREPTGSPVEMKVSTIAVRTSRSRLPILGSDGIAWPCALSPLESPSHLLTGLISAYPQSPHNAERIDMKSKPHIAVIGAGAFGGWTALHLLERGARVTLIDAWGPGNSRASSGGETRIMRGTYGPDQPYTEMAARALKLWTKYKRRWKRQFLHRTGVLWMVPAHDDAFERGSIKLLRAAKIKFQELSAPQLKKRWPQINFEGIEWTIFEPECGYLDARASCQAVVDAFVTQGGAYRQLAVSSEGLENAATSSSLRSITLSNGSQLKADYYVFACGPWLGKLFPQTLGDIIRPTKQDIFFFGTPAGDSRFTDEHLPVWGDHGERFFYGIPGNDQRGFKVADDTRGGAFDPTNGERVVSQATLKRVREYIAF